MCVWELQYCLSFWHLSVSLHRYLMPIQFLSPSPDEISILSYRSVVHYFNNEHKKKRKLFDQSECLQSIHVGVLNQRNWNNQGYRMEEMRSYVSKQSALVWTFLGRICLDSDRYLVCEKEDEIIFFFRTFHLLEFRDNLCRYGWHKQGLKPEFLARWQWKYRLHGNLHLPFSAIHRQLHIFVKFLMKVN